MESYYLGTNHLLSDSAGARFGRSRGLGRALLGETVNGEEPDFLNDSFCGVYELGGHFLGDVIPLSGIWKRRRVKGELRFYCEPYYIPRDPKSEKQILWRGRIASAVLEWQSLFLGCSENGDLLLGDSQEWYNKKVSKTGKSGYNYFIKKALLSH